MPADQATEPRHSVSGSSNFWNIDLSPRSWHTRRTPSSIHLRVPSPNGGGSESSSAHRGSVSDASSSRLSNDGIHNVYAAPDTNVLDHWLSDAPNQSSSLPSSRDRTPPPHESPTKRINFERLEIDDSHRFRSASPSPQERTDVLLSPAMPPQGSGTPRTSRQFNALEILGLHPLSQQNIHHSQYGEPPHTSPVLSPVNMDAEVEEIETEEKDKLEGRTLLLFSENSNIRQTSLEILKWKLWGLVHTILAVVELIILCVETGISVFAHPLKPARLSWYTWVHMPAFIFYTINSMLGCIAFGVFTTKSMTKKELILCPLVSAGNTLCNLLLAEAPDRAETTIAEIIADTERKTAISRSNKLSFAKPQSFSPFLTQFSSWLELISVVCFWVWLGLTFKNAPESSFVIILGGLAHLRLLRLLTTWGTTRVVVAALRVALPHLRTVLLLIAMFWMAFTVTGQQSFMSSMRRHCVWVDSTGIQPNYTTDHFCGSHIDPVSGAIMPYVDSDGKSGARAKGVVCPEGSFCVVGEGPHDGTIGFDTIFNSAELVFVIMSQNTYTDIMHDIMDSEYLASSLFFIAGVIILNYWLINSLVATLASCFNLVWRRAGGKRAQAQPNTEIDHLALLRRTKIGRGYLSIMIIFPILIILDLAFQASWADKSDVDPIYNFFFPWEVFLAALFMVEIIVRFLLYAPYWSLFFKSKVNIADTFLGVVNVGILFANSFYIVYAWLTIFQLARFYRVMASFKVVRQMFTMIIGSYQSIFDLTAFYFGVTFIFSVIVCKMLRGIYPEMNDDGEVMNSSFYSLGNAFNALYQISSTENWTDVLYDAVEGCNTLIARIIVACILCGWLAFSNFVVVNMFVAVMTENLTFSGINKRKEQVRAFIKTYFGRNFSLTKGNRHKLRPKFRKLWPNNSPDISEKASKLNEIPSLQHIAQKDILTEFLKSNIEEPDEPVQDIEANNPILSAALSSPLPVILKRLLSKTLDLFRHYLTARVVMLRSPVSQHYMDSPPPPPPPPPPQERNTQLAPEGLSTDPNRPDVTLHEDDVYVQTLYDTHNRAQTQMDFFRQEEPLYDKPLFLFSVDNKFRRFAQHIFHPSCGIRASGIKPRAWVEYLPMTFMFIASIVMIVSCCVNTPLYQIEYVAAREIAMGSWTWITYIDIILTFFFLLEFFLKIAADGFHFTPNAYTQNPWNLIDLLVLVSMLLTLISDFIYGPISRYSRMFMALRVLRLITLSPSCKRVFESMFFTGFGNILVAGFIAFAVVFPFSVWGVNLFHDDLYSCNDLDLSDLSHCINEYTASPYRWEIWAPRAIKKPYFDYDSIWSSLMIQFGVLSLEGWTDVRKAVTSIAGVGLNPVAFSSPYNAIYPTLYNFCGTVLVMTMFMAVVIRNYALSKTTAFMTADQLSWFNMRRNLRLVKPLMRNPTYDPESIKFALLQAVENPRSLFNLLQLWLLLTINIVMMVKNYYMGALGRTIINFMVAFCSLGFFATYLTKLWVLKPKKFLRDYWNLYALIATLWLGILSLCLEVSPDVVISDLHKIGVVGVLALWIQRVRRVRQLFSIALTNLAPLLTVVQTWFVLHLTFAVALNQSFGLIKFGATTAENLNFRTVPKALILLFRMSTGEGWNQILSDFTISKPYCVTGEFFDNECGVRWLATFFFVAWNIISMYIMTYLFISVIYDTFWYLYRQEASTISKLDLELFQRNWMNYDPRGTGLISREDFHTLLMTTSGYFSMGIYSKDPDYNVQTIIKRTGLRISYTNPYLVNWEGLNSYLEYLPVAQFRRKRELYELFCEHIMYYADHKTGKFKLQRILKLFPLYTDMDPSKVLPLKGFLRLKILLHQCRIFLAIDVISRRYLLYRQLHNIRAASPPGSKEMASNSGHSSD